MKKFELYNPIRMVFGVDEFKRLGELASDYGVKPLVVTGKSFARESGIIDQAVKILEKAGMSPVVFEGIEPNPRLDTIQLAAHTAVDNECDMVIGIGGGSVMDASKVIAFGYFDPDNIWKHVATWRDDYEPVGDALPIVLVSTLAASGSEGDAGGVITNPATNEKFGVFSESLFPKVSIIDPKLQMSTPIEYTRDGAVDMSIHVLEGYFNTIDEAPFSDRCSESFFLEVMIALEEVMAKPQKIEPRSKLAYLSMIALNGFINRPRGGAFPLHALEHPLSAFFDISHGRGLAMLLPRWLKYVSREKPDKIIQFGDRIFNMQLETHHPFEAADKVIKRIIEWLEEINAWFFMDSLGIPNDPEIFRKMAESAIRMYGGEDGMIGGIKPLGVNDVVEIYEMCVRRGAKAEKALIPDLEEQEASTESEDEESTDQMENVEEFIIIEEVIELADGEEIPEGMEGEEYIIVEEIIEEEVIEEEPQK